MTRGPAEFTKFLHQTLQGERTSGAVWDAQEMARAGIFVGRDQIRSPTQNGHGVVNTVAVKDF